MYSIILFNIYLQYPMYSIILFIIYLQASHVQYYSV